MRSMTPRPIPLRPDREALAEASIAALTRAALSNALAIVNRQQSPSDICKTRWPEDRLAQFLTRAASAPAMTTVPTWAAELVQSVTADFLIGLGPHSAASEIFQAALSLTFDGSGQIRLPHFVADFQNAGFVGENQPIPVQNLSLDNPNPLTPHKAAAIALLTREMVESSNAEQLVGDTLKRAAGRMLDEVLFDANPAATNRPAGLRNGIAAVTPSAATESDRAFVDDMGKLADAVSPVASNSDLIYIASPGRALKINLRMPREIDNVIVLGSNAVINDLLCIACNAFVAAVGAAPQIHASKAAVLHADSVPQAVPAARTVSTFQTDCVALKLLWPVSWSLRDSRGFAWTTPTGW
jgi:Phage capsid family